MIQNKIEDNLAEEILAEKVKQGDKVTVSYKNKSVTFSVAEQFKMYYTRTTKKNR